MDEDIKQRLQEQGLRLYDLKELEEYFGVTNRTLQRWIHSGRLKATKIGGKWKVTEQAVKEFLNSK